MPNIYNIEGKNIKAKDAGKALEKFEKITGHRKLSGTDITWVGFKPTRRKSRLSRKGR